MKQLNFSPTQLRTVCRLQAELKARGFDLTLEQVQRIRLVQSDMTLSGFPQTIEEVASNVADYWASGDDETIERLVETARREGRSQRDVFREHYGPPGPPKAIPN